MRSVTASFRVLFAALALAAALVLSLGPANAVPAAIGDHAVVHQVNCGVSCAKASCADQPGDPSGGAVDPAGCCSMIAACCLTGIGLHEPAVLPVVQAIRSAWTPAPPGYLSAIEPEAVRRPPRSLI